jgi:hypothetical protein
MVSLVKTALAGRLASAATAATPVQAVTALREVQVSQLE